MEIHYERKANQSFMVMEGKAVEQTYEEEMLRQNEIKILLSFYTIEMNRRIQYWYDITGKQSLRDYLEREGLYPENMKEILLYLGIAYEEMTNYLISQEHLYMSADTVFVEQTGNHLGLFFCYRPDLEISVQQQMQDLFEFFLTMVDHSMTEFMSLCYAFYERIIRGDFTIATMQEEMTEFQEQNQEEQEGPYVEHVVLQRKEEVAPLEEATAWFEHAPLDEEDVETPFVNEDIGFMQIFKNIWQAICEKGKKLQIPKFRKSVSEEQLEEEVYVYDPEEDCSLPTVLLHSGEQECAGKLIYEGAGEETDILINKDIFRIGSRGKDNDAVLHSTGVSRYHARIVKKGERYFLEDLNSTNGTYVNGKQLSYKEKMPLQTMDQIRFADVLYRMV